MTTPQEQPDGHTKGRKVTDLRPGIYGAADRSDVLHLAFVLECTPKRHAAVVASAITANGLMRGPWWFQMLVGLIRLRGRTAERLNLVYTRMPDLARDLILEAARHIRHGKDREETSSVGGLSQRETDIMVSILRAKEQAS